MSTTENKQNHKNRLAVYVRCTPEEYAILDKLSTDSGESAASILKKKFFESKVVQTFLPEVERKEWFRELSKIGNNLNQLAKKVNTGIYEGWYPEFRYFNESLNQIRKMVVSVYGSSNV